MSRHRSISSLLLVLALGARTPAAGPITSYPAPYPTVGEIERLDPALDHQGRVVLAQHGDRRIARLNPDGRSFTTVADRYDGKRFNSPNDLCYDRRGNLYLTDPPYGTGPSTKIELDFSGVFRVSTDGQVTLLSRELARPNGIGLSPDERTLYVDNTDGARPVILAFDLHPDGTVGPSRVFFDAKSLIAQGRRGSFDGMDVDVEGNLWTTGPGGVLIISPAGKLLGAIHPGMANSNTAFGGEDGTTLYITAGSALLRIKTKIKGAAF